MPWGPGDSPDDGILENDCWAAFTSNHHQALEIYPPTPHARRRMLFGIPIGLWSGYLMGKSSYRGGSLAALVACVTIAGFLMILFGNIIVLEMQGISSDDSLAGPPGTSMNFGFFVGLLWGLKWGKGKREEHMTVGAVDGQPEPTGQQDLNFTPSSRQVGTAEEFPAMVVSETDLYRQVAEEMETGDRDKGLWLRARVECDGDTQRAEVFYARERVKELKTRNSPAEMNEVHGTAKLSGKSDVESHSSQRHAPPKSAEDTSMSDPLRPREFRCPSCSYLFDDAHHISLGQRFEPVFCPSCGIKANFSSVAEASASAGTRTQATADRAQRAAEGKAASSKYKRQMAEARMAAEEKAGRKPRRK